MKAEHQTLNGGASYLTADHLGSARLVTNSSGAVIARHDYLPFGAEISATTGGSASGRTAQGYGATDDTRQKFTSKERDVESGLDFFEARSYSPGQGRFTSVDPLEINLGLEKVPANGQTKMMFQEYLSNPQRWNRYAYVLNSPSVLTDPTGTDILIIENGPTEGDQERPGSNPYGHTAIAISDRGVYSVGDAPRDDPHRDAKGNIIGGGVRDYLNQELKRRDTTLMIIKTTPEQDAAAANKLQDIARTAPQITLSPSPLQDNCSTRVNQALDAAGVPPAPAPVNPPPETGLYRPPDLPNIPGSAGDRAKGVDGAQTIQVPKGSPLPGSTIKAVDQFEPVESPPSKRPDN